MKAAAKAATDNEAAKAIDAELEKLAKRWPPL